MESFSNLLWKSAGATPAIRLSREESGSDTRLNSALGFFVFFLRTICNSWKDIHGPEGFSPSFEVRIKLDVPQIGNLRLFWSYDWWRSDWSDIVRAVGGDKGIIKAMITHPKPSEEALIVPTNKSLVLQDSMLLFLKCPSKVPLEVVPIWIRIYDLPLALMIKARGQLYGSRFGHVRKVDVEEDGRNRHDFFRIRVDLPVKKPLKSKLAIKINAQGTEVVIRFDVRYKWIPYFCFCCGFIGHSDKDCEKKVANSDAPYQFSEELRCSLLKAYERKVKDPKDITVSASSLKGDMIPAIANLHQPASFWETWAEDTTSILKRRTPDLVAIKETGRVKQALLQFGQEDTASRKDQAEPSLQGRQLKRFKQVDTDKQDLEDMEATSPGVVGKLVGPTMGSRQEQ
ncbi:hypothetical protein OsJ_17930 [Oryza sativa Japonica Group]|uniref:CCHC-type domain-containing protein n=1 Tax=Oryza sativa subsp. japonica TaxID=39947 RepID=B9FNP8_ORYSJ|nr:hypothetical protein OsJ_17930 [Oryza sativa Japonica Group]